LNNTETKNQQKSSKSLEFKASNLRRSTSFESISSVKKTSIDSLPEINKENVVVVIESKPKQIVKPSVMKKTWFKIGSRKEFKVRYSI
jgi:hypothetical protein